MIDLKRFGAFCSLVFCLFAVPAFAQFPPLDLTTMSQFAAFREVTLSGASEAVTLQLPAASSQATFPQWLNVYCSSTCVISIEKGGTAASSTLATATPLNFNTATSLAEVRVGSNSTGGTIVNKITCSTTCAIDLRYIRLLQFSPSVQALTFRTDTITATVRMSVIWAQR